MADPAMIHWTPVDDPNEKGVLIMGVNGKGLVKPILVQPGQKVLYNLTTGEISVMNPQEIGGEERPALSLAELREWELEAIAGRGWEPNTVLRAVRELIAIRIDEYRAEGEPNLLEARYARLRAAAEAAKDRLGVNYRPNEAFEILVAALEAEK